VTLGFSLVSTVYYCKVAAKLYICYISLACVAVLGLSLHKECVSDKQKEDADATVNNIEKGPTHAAIYAGVKKLAVCALPITHFFRTILSKRMVSVENLSSNNIY